MSDQLPGQVDLCPLCGRSGASPILTSQGAVGRRDFFHCAVCDLVFVPRTFHLEAGAQKERYLQHNNDPTDQRYRSFLARLLDHLRPHLRPGASGLDYGAGPGPALAIMMREEGFSVRTYDPLFHPDESALEETYDFITCTETAEHFSSPRDEFDRLQALLKPLGWLGVMTGMLEDWSEFGDWYYHRDPTHISFFSRRTMSWIADRYSWKARFPRPNVVLFHKEAGPC